MDRQLPQYLLGVDIGGTHLRLALATSSGTILEKWRATLTIPLTPNAVIDQIGIGMRTLAEQTNVPLNSIAAAGVGAPGITDVEQGLVIATSYLLGWRNVPLQALMQEKLQIAATIDNDVNLAALGELHACSDQAYKDLVFVAVGTGIGAGIVINGAIHHGSTWAAGEIGYMLVPGVSEAPSERGQPGSLESVAGGAGIQAHWRSHWSPDRTKLSPDASATEIFAEAEAGGLLATEILAGAARVLAYAIYNTSLLLNCPRFILGGGVGAHPAFLAAIQRSVHERKARTPIVLLPSALGPEAQLAGAIVLARQTAAALAMH